MNLLAPKIHLSEHFDSIQGEGKTAGYPAIFWRFKGCVLQCIWCDTVEVWKKGTAYTFEEIYDLFNQSGDFKLLNSAKRMLVVTGGDPLIQQEKIADFFEFCSQRGEQVGNWRIEVETQGSLLPSSRFASYVSQWNVSPKLTNSGMPLEKRIVPAVVTKLRGYNSIFKFPVIHEQDLLEVQDYLGQFNIPANRVWLMPVASTRLEHEVNGLYVISLCMEYGYRYSPRLQLVFWNRATGV